MVYLVVEEKFYFSFFLFKSLFCIYVRLKFIKFMNRKLYRDKYKFIYLDIKSYFFIYRKGWFELEIFLKEDFGLYERRILFSC